MGPETPLSQSSTLLLRALEAVVEREDKLFIACNSTIFVGNFLKKRYLSIVYAITYNINITTVEL